MHTSTHKCQLLCVCVCSLWTQTERTHAAAVCAFWVCTYLLHENTCVCVHPWALAACICRLCVHLLHNNALCARVCVYLYTLMSPCCMCLLCVYIFTAENTACVWCVYPWAPVACVCSVCVVRVHSAVLVDTAWAEQQLMARPHSLDAHTHRCPDTHAMSCSVEQSHTLWKCQSASDLDTHTQTHKGSASRQLDHAARFSTLSLQPTSVALTRTRFTLTLTDQISPKPPPCSWAPEGLRAVSAQNLSDAAETHRVHPECPESVARVPHESVVSAPSPMMGLSRVQHNMQK